MSPRRTTLGAVTTTTACVMPVFLVGGLAVQVGEELGFSPAGLGVAVAIYFGVSALTSVPAGALVERYGAAVTARVAIVLAAASMLAIAAAAREFAALVGLLAAGAAANGLGQLASNASLTRVPPGRQGLSFGIKQAAIPAATLLAGASVPAVALTIGWRWAFVIAAAVATAALALVPNPGRAAGAPQPRRTNHHQRATSEAPGLATLGQRFALALLPIRSQARSLVVIGAAVALGAASAGSLGTFLVDSAASRGLAPGLAGLTLTLGSLACMTGRIGGGWLADRRGAHGDVTTVAVLLVVGAVGLSLLAVPGPAALAAGVLLGFGFGWAFPGLVNLAVVQLHPDAPAAATAITQTGVYAGGAFGPVAFGATAAAHGYPVAWLGGAVAMLLASVLVLLGRRLLRAGPRAGLRIRPARATELPALQDIERAAGEVFREIGMAPVADDEPPPLAELTRYQRAGRAWVATDPADRPVAYLVVEPVDGNLHIEQVSVHPRFARRGLGRRLIEHVARRAAASRVPALTLTTFTEVPWNAPYYARCGFRPLADGDLTPGLREIRRREAAHGLDRWPRVCMRRDL